MRVAFLSVLPVVLVMACTTAPPQAPLSSDPELNRFARTVEEELEAHAWQNLISRAERSHYRSNVVEHGMPEAQYIAELFGLHRVDNDIKRGDVVEWADLERIRSVELRDVTRRGGRELLIGTVSLNDGSTLELQAQIARENGRYLLTGGRG